ncbi:MAG: Crp/Fnr family transcriptional regulator [Pseudomonadota bacterium]
MRISERFPHVARFDLLDGLPRTTLRTLLDAGVARVLSKDQVLLSEGHRADAVSLILDGVIDITRLGPDSQRVLLHRARAGALVGDIEVLGEIPCIATCEATCASTVLVFGRAHFLEALEIPLFRRNLFRLQARRLDRANQIRVLDSVVPIQQRVAVYLRYLAREAQVIDANQSYLADLVGCSRQTINRELSALRAIGVIETQNSRIRILDATGLAARAGMYIPN